MKFVAAICAVALTLAGTIPSATAATYAPAGSFTFQGFVVFKKGLTLNCTLKLFITVPEAAPDSHGTFSHGHSATVTPVLSAPSNILCPTITFSGTPYVFTSDASYVNISGVVINTIVPGGCSGMIQGTWGGNSTTPRFISLNASLPGGGTSDPCLITGTLNQVSGIPLSITAVP